MERRPSVPEVSFSKEPTSPLKTSSSWHNLPQKLSLPKSADESKTEFNTPEGRVKQVGGGIEKSIAAHAAAPVHRSRGNLLVEPQARVLAKKLVPPALHIEPENLKRNSKASDDTASLDTVVLESSLVRSWFMAGNKNDTATIKELANQEPELVKMRDLTGDGYTVLHWAAHHGNIQMAKFLIDSHQMDVNVRARSRSGYSPLHVAALHQKEEMIKMLMDEYHANAEMEDYGGKKPLMYLASSSRQSTVSRNSHFSKKPKSHSLLSSTVSSGIRRFGSFNSKVRSSMMRKFGNNSSQTSLMKESASSPGPYLEEETADALDSELMPPPTSLPNLRGSKRRTSDAELIRRGSQGSVVSRSDSVITIDDVKLAKAKTNGKMFDSGSETASFRGSDSYDSLASKEDVNAVPVVEKISSPLAYMKSLNGPDDGSQV